MEKIDLEGLVNCYKVSQALYRCGQPTRKGFENIKELGVKAIINLRWIHTDRRLVKGLGFLTYHIRAKAWHGEAEDIQRFLGIMGMKRNVPALVHCQFGADRTGMMVAAYRIFHENWSLTDAVREMVAGPFGFHEVFGGLAKLLENFKR